MYNVNNVKYASFYKRADLPITDFGMLLDSI